MQNKKILVTGGAGYIGSHACVSLLEAGYGVVVVDNLSNSSEESLRRVRSITGGELTIDMLDLAYNPVSRVYEAPAQLKAGLARQAEPARRGLRLDEVLVELGHVRPEQVRAAVGLLHRQSHVNELG